MNSTRLPWTHKNIHNVHAVQLSVNYQKLFSTVYSELSKYFETITPIDKVYPLGSTYGAAEVGQVWVLCHHLQGATLCKNCHLLRGLTSDFEHSIGACNGWIPLSYLAGEKWHLCKPLSVILCCFSLSLDKGTKLKCTQIIRLKLMRPQLLTSLFIITWWTWCSKEEKNMDLGWIHFTYMKTI